MAIKFKVDFRDTVKDLDKVASKQVPFAMAKSLTMLAQKAQGAIRANTSKKFDLKAERFIKRGIRIKPANKKDFRMSAEVFTDRKIDFMVRHEEGGTFKPPKAKSHAVPSRTLKAKNYRTGTGKVRKRFKPRVLLKHFNTVRGSRGSQPSTRGRKAFIMEAGDQNMIVRRISAKSDRTELLYLFRRKIKIKGTWGFEKTVRGVVFNNYNRIFADNLKDAIRTAR